MGPKFSKNGDLLNDYYCGLDELKLNFSFSRHRKLQLTLLEEAIAVLKNDYGIKTLYIGGTFASTKKKPSDIDGVIDLEERNVPKDLLFLLEEKYKMDFYFKDTLTKLTNEPHLAFFKKNRDGRSRGLIILDISRQ